MNKDSSEAPVFDGSTFGSAMKKHKSKYSKEYKIINKALKEKCCKCHYVKKKKSIRRVKGPWPHCSYDSNNCCKDKKNIIKSKN